MQVAGLMRNSWEVSIIAFAVNDIKNKYGMVVFEGFLWDLVGLVVSKVVLSQCSEGFLVYYKFQVSRVFSVYWGSWLLFVLPVLYV